MRAYALNEKLVWIHVDEDTGDRMNDLVIVRSRKPFAGKPYYIVTIVRTGEPVQAWHDELFRFQG